MKKIFAFLCALAVALSLVSCNNEPAPNPESGKTDISVTKLGEGENVFEFTVADADGTETAFEISTDKEFVGDALKEHNLIDGEDGQFGMYVKTVNGITYDFNKDGKYWAFYINGEYATSGVDKTTITKGDSYMFKAE